MADYTDNFNAYTNGGLPGQGTWLSGGLALNPQVSSGTITDNSSALTSMAYNDVTIGGDQYSEVVVTTMGSTTDEGSGPVVRAGSVLGYFAQCNLFGGGEVTIYKITSGPTFTPIGAVFTGTLANGDTIRLTAEGSASPVTLRVKRNGSEIFNRTDSSSVLTGGKPGLMSAATPIVMDNWAGGDLAAAGDLSVSSIGEPVIGGSTF